MAEGSVWELFHRVHQEMMVSRLIYSNVDFDLRFSEEIPAHLEPVIAEGTLYGLWCGDGSDHVLVDAEPDAEFLEYCESLGLELPQIHGSPETVPVSLSASPWGWNDEAIDRFRIYRARCENPDLETVRLVNSRQFSSRIGEEHRCGVPGTVLCRSAREVFAWCTDRGDREAVFKPLHGNAGHGFLRTFGGPLSQRFQRRVRAHFLTSRRPGLYAEIWFHRLMDFSMRFHLSNDGQCGPVGFHRTRSNSAGVFHGLYLSPDESWFARWRDDLERIVPIVAAALHHEGYFGTVGIDCMIVADDQGQPMCIPLVEINAREPMSTILYSLRERLCAGRHLLLEVAPAAYYQFPETLRDVVKKAGALHYHPDRGVDFHLLTPLTSIIGRKRHRTERLLLLFIADTAENLAVIENEMRRLFGSTPEAGRRIHIAP